MEVYVFSKADQWKHIIYLHAEASMPHQPVMHITLPYFSNICKVNFPLISFFGFPL